MEKRLPRAILALVAVFHVSLYTIPCKAEPRSPSVDLPQLLSDADVTYPAAQTGDHEVILELTIDAGGNVREARVISGLPPFSDVARAAAMTWVFTPARRDDVAVSSRIRFAVSFTEPESSAPDEAPVALDPRPEASAAQTPPTQAPTAPAEVDVIVSGHRTVSGERLKRVEVRQLPGAFGDPFRAIESLPGVTPTLSGAPYFYVRGSPPGNLGLFLDDVRLPSLYHVFAGPPVVHPAMLDEVEFYPGPYPARFGRAAGGIAAGHSVAPTHVLHGEASVRAFDSSALVEVPLVGDDVSLIGGGRFSYANPIAHLFAPDISVNYWDYQAKLVGHPGHGNSVTVFAFGARDLLTRSNDEDGGDDVPIIDSEFHRIDVRYTRQLHGGHATLATTVGTDRSKLSEGNVRLEAPLVSVRGDVQTRVSDSVAIQSGVEVGSTWHRSELASFDEPQDRDDYARRFPSRLESVGAAYVGMQWAATGDVHVDAGLRTDVVAQRDEAVWSVDPRLSVQYELSPRVTLEHAVGIAHQPPGNPALQPGATPALGDGLQRAVQSSAGIRTKLPGEFSLRITAFQAILLNLSDGPGVSRLDNGDESIDENSRSLGSARGVELLLSRSFTKRLGGFIAYTLSNSRRSLGRAEGPALFDRRHVLSGALGYRFDEGYSLGIRGAFYTGIPADVAYIEAAKDPPRTTPFYRIDVRAEKRWKLGSSGASWAIVLEMLNVTLHTEILNKSCNAYVCRENEVGPVAVPSAGLEANF